ncbi:hypothetical protein CCACVL1_29025, partial [Corchorus capsularis]
MALKIPTASQIPACFPAMTAPEGVKGDTCIVPP